jgi:lipopolysaccharide transport system ATP-binding protein
MHRSGTSLLVRLLEQAGIRLPPNLLPAAADNPEGFQESADFVALNEALLARDGSTWDGCWPLPSSVDPAPVRGLDDLCHATIQAWLAALQAGDLLALKDPRLCRTLPAWQQLLPTGACRWGIAIVRHPFAVVRSIGYRDDMHPLKALALWMRHNLDLLPSGADAQRDWPVIGFEPLLQRSQATLGPVLEAWAQAGWSVDPHAALEASVRQPMPAIPLTLEGIDAAWQALALRFYDALLAADRLGGVDAAVVAEVDGILNQQPLLPQRLLAIETARRHQLGQALATERRGVASPDRLLGEADWQRLEAQQRPTLHSKPLHFALRGVVVELGGRRQRRSLRQLALGLRRPEPAPPALDGLDLEVQEGERMALLGHNGSGKTSLLRLLSGIYQPTAGSFHCHGPLLEPIIEQSLGYSHYLNGWQICYYSYLLHHRSELSWDQFREQIEGFTELGPALATPIKTWSQGMQTRLSFALITSRRLRGLALDEGLMAGDQWFQRKAKARLDQFMDQNGTVVLASHAVDLLQRYCSRGVILERGRIRFDGSLFRALQLYQGMV